MKKDSKKSRDIATVVAEVTTGMVLGPGAAATVKIAGRVLKPVLEHMAERRERRAKVFVEELLGSGYPRETTIPLVEAEMERAPAETKDAVADAIRAIDDVISDKIVPALALLAREYVRSGRPKDRVFVAVLQLLRMLDDKEYDTLKVLVAIAAASWGKMEEGMGRSSGSIAKFVEDHNHDNPSMVKIGQNTSLPWDVSHDALIRSLTVAGLATMDGGLTTVGIMDSWTIPRDEWDMLAKIIK